MKRVLERIYRYRWLFISITMITGFLALFCKQLFGLSWKECIIIFPITALCVAISFRIFGYKAKDFLIFIGIIGLGLGNVKGEEKKDLCPKDLGVLISFKSKGQNSNCFIEDTVVWKFREDRIDIETEIENISFNVRSYKTNIYFEEDDMLCDIYDCEGWKIEIDKNPDNSEILQINLKRKEDNTIWYYRF